MSHLSQEPALHLGPVAREQVMADSVDFDDEIPERFACRYVGRDVSKDQQACLIVLHLLKEEARLSCAEVKALGRKTAGRHDDDVGSEP